MSKNSKKNRWCWHIGMSERVAFRPHEKKLMLTLFAADLDDEISKAKKSHWIEVEARWRNTGCYRKQLKKFQIIHG